MGVTRPTSSAALGAARPDSGNASVSSILMGRAASMERTLAEAGGRKKLKRWVTHTARRNAGDRAGLRNARCAPTLWPGFARREEHNSRTVVRLLLEADRRAGGR